MKKILVSILTLLMLISPSFVINAEETLNATAWFFKKNNEHKQPVLDSRLSFIEKYNCRYVDKMHGDGNEDKVLYLTFDAGYENGNIELILNEMKAQNVAGSFFILENLVKKNPELVKRMADEGHLVCNHTARHRDMSRVKDIETFEKELKRLEDAYTECTQKQLAKIYRPPEGRFSELNLQFTDSLGYKTVFWSFAYEDWDNNKQMSEDKAIEKVLGGTHNGAVILLHPTSSTNAKIISRLITEWKSQGYRFETLDNLA